MGGGGDGGGDSGGGTGGGGEGGGEGGDEGGGEGDEGGGASRTLDGERLRRDPFFVGLDWAALEAKRGPVPFPDLVK